MFSPKEVAVKQRVCTYMSRRASLQRGLSNAQGLQRDTEGCNSGYLVSSSQLCLFRASLGVSLLHCLTWYVWLHICHKEIMVLTAAGIVLTMESLGTAVRGAIETEERI